MLRETPRDGRDEDRPRRSPETLQVALGGADGGDLTRYGGHTGHVLRVEVCPGRLLGLFGCCF